MLRRNVIAITLVAAVAAAGPVSAGAASRYDRDTVIVKYRDGVSTAERGSLRERTRLGPVVERVTAVDAYVARVEGDPAAAAARLERSPKVAYAEPDAVVRAAGARPDDPRFDRQWALHNTGQTGGRPDADIDAPGGWSRLGLGSFPATGGPPIGIIDTGIDQGHPEFEGKVAGCHSFYGDEPGDTCADDNGHGTHVAGIAAARADNGRGIAGAAFNSPLIVCRAIGGSGQADGRASDVADCIDWLHDQGAAVINMSLQGGRSETLQRAVRRAWSGGGHGGSVLVAAAGNGGFSTSSYPAGFQQVISVSATTSRDERASFSNRNQDVELAAPGDDILSTWPGGRYEVESGTSMAAPLAAGVAAQLHLGHTGARAGRIRVLLQKSVDDLGADGRDASFGFGRINLGEAARR
jgi:thermitase